MKTTGPMCMENAKRIMFWHADMCKKKVDLID